MKLSFLNNHRQTKNRTPRAEKGRLPHDLSTDPFLDWILILALSAAVAIALVAVGVSVYLDTGTTLSEAPSAVPQTSSASIDTGVLQSVLNRFDAKAAEQSSILKSFGTLKDPSLP